MIDINILRVCATSWPSRPNLRYAEWPYSQEVLDHSVDVAMDAIEKLVGGAE